MSTPPTPYTADPSDNPPASSAVPTDPAADERTFRAGVAMFNGVRYWHAHEEWEALWRTAPAGERDFYQGLIQIAAGLLHLQRRNARGARNKLAEGIDKLQAYQPAHRGVFVNELIGEATRLLVDLQAGRVPYLIPPVIRFTDALEPDFSR